MPIRLTHQSTTVRPTATSFSPRPVAGGNTASIPHAARRAIEGWYSGTSIDAQDTLAFSAQSGVTSMNESYPLEKAPEAFDRMLSGKARFRVVLTM